MLDQLRRLLIQYATLAYSLYDGLELDPTSAIGQLAITRDNRRTRENPVRMEQAFVFPQVAAWSGGKIISGADFDRIQWVVPLAGKSASVPYDKLNIGRPSAQQILEEYVRMLPMAWNRAVLADLMAVFRDNPLAYDGQNFFDSDHEHPAGKGSYSNLLSSTVNVTTPGEPTFAEVQALIREARQLFVANMTIDAQLLRAGELTNAMVVIVHNAAHWSMFERVRTEAQVSNVANPYVNTFQLWLDAQPASGADNYIEFLNLLPNGPRPAFYVPDLDPKLDAWEDPNQAGYVHVGLKDGIYGVKPGFPQCALQARLT